MMLKNAKAAVLAALVASAIFVRANAQDIWFCPWAKTATEAGVIKQDEEFLNLFRQPALWARAAKEVSVFEFSSTFAYHATDQDLSRAIAVLNDRKIKIALGVAPLFATKRCGSNVESYNQRGIPKETFQRMKNLGAVVSYAVLDEPLFYGNKFSGPNACRDDLTGIAKQVATTISDITSVFPEVKWVDVEPLAGFSPQEWKAILPEWFEVLARSGTQKFTYFRLDLDWNSPKLFESFEAVRSIVAQNDVTLGVIYNGNDNASSSEQWLKQASAHAIMINDRFGRPGQISYQSWVKFPQRLMPDSQAGTFTNFIAELAKP